MIPKPQRDDEGKVQGEFYPLQKAELMALRKAKLINNAAFVHLALRYENPWCDRKIIVIPKEFGMRWQIPESSVYEAIAKLKEASAINIKSGRITIEWANSQQGKSDDSQQEDDSGNPENFGKSRNDSENPEKITESQKKLRNPRKNSGSSENRASKPSTGKDSTTLQTIQTYLDFIDSLSEAERENFLEFGKKKAAELPKLPTLPLKWIEKNFEDIRFQWLQSRDDNENQNQKYNFAAYSQAQHQMWYGQLQSVVSGAIQSGDRARLEQFLKDDFYSSWLNWAKTAREDVREFLVSNPIPTENPAKAE